MRHPSIGIHVAARPLIEVQAMEGPRGDVKVFNQAVLSETSDHESMMMALAVSGARSHGDTGCRDVFGVAHQHSKTVYVHDFEIAQKAVAHPIHQYAVPTA